MKKFDCYSQILDLLEFKTISDEQGNEYVVFAGSALDPVKNIPDRTAFEAVENHVHLLERIRKADFEALTPLSRRLGQAVLNSLRFQFPEKRFIVYVSMTLNGSMILRFHQKWPDEAPYYDPADFPACPDLVLAFEN